MHSRSVEQVVLLVSTVLLAAAEPAYASDSFNSNAIGPSLAQMTRNDPPEGPPRPVRRQGQEGSGAGMRDRDRMPDAAVVDPITFCAITRGPDCDINHAIERGLFETGLTPLFPDNVLCRGIDEGYAISYAGKRPREVFHGGIDMPAPTGTPIIASAAGTVVGKFRGEHSARGIELVLRHSPDDTGLPLWIYTQYAHFTEMPKHEIGQRVRLGEVLGPTGNTGIAPLTGRQSGRRRPAIHFAVFYSSSDRYAEAHEVIFPENARWMDPVALFRQRLPLDSFAMKVLPAAEKKIPISYMLENGQFFPSGTRIVWPYTCSPR